MSEENHLGHDARLTGLVGRARDGDRAALEELMAALKDDVYGLALKMLWHPQDAEDATQEILIRIFTRLDTFRGESSIRTWAFRVACNHLLTTRKRRMERSAMSFEEFGEDLTAGLASDSIGEGCPPDAELLEEEVKIGCTQGMLLCLDREHRLAYILGEVFGVSSAEASGILEITPASYRKRLSRARRAIRGFMSRHCGLVSRSAPCHCRRRIKKAIEAGRLDPDELLFVGAGTRARQNPALLEGVKEMEELHATAAVFRSNSDRAAPDQITSRIQRLLRSDRFDLLNH